MLYQFGITSLWKRCVRLVYFYIHFWL